MNEVSGLCVSVGVTSYGLHPFILACVDALHPRQQFLTMLG